MARHRTRRMLWAALACLASLAVVLPLACVLVLLLAGPHGGLAPDWMAGPVRASGWLAVLGLPAWCARRAWRRAATRIAPPQRR